MAINAELIGTVIVAVTGLITTGLAPVVSSRVEARAARQTFSRDQVSSVLVDAVSYAQNLQRKVHSWPDEWGILKAEPLEGPPIDVLTAKMRLTVSTRTFEAWDVMVTGWDRVLYGVNLNGPKSGDPNGNAFDLDDEDVKQLLGRITRFLNQARVESEQLYR